MINFFHYSIFLITVFSISAAEIIFCYENLSSENIHILKKIIGIMSVTSLKALLNLLVLLACFLVATDRVSN